MRVENTPASPAPKPMKANAVSFTRRTSMPICAALSGLSPTQCTRTPKRWRWYSMAAITTNPTAQNI